MRGARLLLPLLVAFAAAGCARQQQTYYVIDPQTGQPVPVVQQGYDQPQYAQAPVAQPQYAQAPQQQYAQAPTTPAANSRGLFGRSPAAAQQSYTQQQVLEVSQYQAPVYAAEPPSQPQPKTSTTLDQTANRGLLTSRARTPVYQQQPVYAQQPAYPVQPAPQYGAGGPYVAAPQQAYTQAYASAPTTYQQGYTLDSGDKLRIVVFGQEGITNSYTVGVDGNVNLPLVGSVPARGYTTQRLSQMIAERLKQGYVREPHVSVEVEAYRPFFILGEVTTPGQYPYVANMTAETAVAIAGGFAARADKRTVEVTRNAPGQQFKGNVPLNYPLRPGDTILVKERWF